MSDTVTINRETKETNISLSLNMQKKAPSSLKTTLPFFDHMLMAMTRHGGFFLDITGEGDTQVDPHHLVEDTGLVLGQALEKCRQAWGGIRRYGEALIPMDDALGQAVVDLGGRPYLVWKVEWPQPWAGDFDLTLLKEFFWGVASAGRLNLHLELRYAQNGHHAAEALFKALGRALSQAFHREGGFDEVVSTKGLI